VPVDLDFCHRCGGLWLDGPKLGAVCPRLADLSARRRLEITLLGREGGGIARCPRCEQVPYEFVVLNIPVSICASCTGVWLDGREYGESPPSMSDAPRSSPYRESVSRALSAGSVTCVGCGRQMPIRSTYMSEWGLLCSMCHAGKLEYDTDRRAEGALERDADRRADDDPPTGDLAEGLLLLLNEGFAPH
jgi:Zn-finger nucleic acid-binding protein